MRKRKRKDRKKREEFRGAEVEEEGRSEGPSHVIYCTLNPRHHKREPYPTAILPRFHAFHPASFLFNFRDPNFIGNPRMNEYRLDLHSGMTDRQASEQAIPNNSNNPTPHR